VDLADAIREVPVGPEHQTLVNRFLLLLEHLEAKGEVRSRRWQLDSRWT
jgi:hypothetical protein